VFNVLPTSLGIVIDALSVGNATRFINDPRNMPGALPNLEAEDATYKSGPHMIRAVLLCAVRDIAVGDELFFRYEQGEKGYWQAADAQVMDLTQVPEDGWTRIKRERVDDTDVTEKLVVHDRLKRVAQIQPHMPDINKTTVDRPPMLLRVITLDGLCSIDMLRKSAQARVYEWKGTTYDGYERLVCTNIELRVHNKSGLLAISVSDAPYVVSAILGLLYLEQFLKRIEEYGKIHVAALHPHWRAAQQWVDGEFVFVGQVNLRNNKPSAQWCGTTYAALVRSNGNVGVYFKICELDKKSIGFGTSHAITAQFVSLRHAGFLAAKTNSLYGIVDANDLASGALGDLHERLRSLADQVMALDITLPGYLFLQSYLELVCRFWPWILKGNDVPLYDANRLREIAAWCAVLWERRDQTDQMSVPVNVLFHGVKLERVFGRWSHIWPCALIE